MSRGVQNARLQAMASSTRKNIVTQVKTYLLFSIYFSLQPFPVTEQALENFIQFLSMNFRSPNAVKNYVVGLQSFSSIKNWSFPDLSAQKFRLQFRGIARIMAHVPTRAEPLSPTILTSFLKFLDLDSSYHVAMWAVMNIGFQLFARLSNLLPPTHGSFDKTRQLLRKDVACSSDAIIISLK